jgi:EPS-associated MarR family transcriptional regulator
VLSDEYRYKILKRLEVDPDLSQRELAQELGISLGKANYCLNALISKGWLKVNNFHSSENKKAYLYYLTPKGAEEKARVTIRFLKYKLAELEALKNEIKELRRDAAVVRSSRGRE